MSGVKAAPGAWLYVVTLFVSAGLLFAVQPMLGKMMLPLVGGSPSGWLTALAFFQLALLAGYLLAHGLSRLSARGQAWATVGVLVLGLVQLPPGFGGAAGVENVGSAWGVLELLVRAIFVPYLGLATVSSGLQRLYAARAGAGSDPYFLYAASNAGSFVGLLAYPLVVEPLVPLSVQSVGWLVGYGLLVALIVALAWPRGGAATAALSTTTSAATVSPLSWRQRGHWVLLAFIPSSLSMGLTSLVTADLGSFPLLWVIPLGLYLLTFVIAFAQRRRLQPEDLKISQVVMVVFMLFLVIWGSGHSLSSWSAALLMTATFFVSALWCHLQLADSRPSGAHLTEYYLWLSLGGALGGVFNVFVAPFVFADANEFSYILFASMILHKWEQNKTKIAGAIFAMIVVCVAAAYNAQYSSDIWKVNVPWVLFGIVPVCLLAIALNPIFLSLTGIGVLLVMASNLNAHHPFDVRRDFFGVAKITDHRELDGQVWRRFFHGSTIHGLQRREPKVDTEAVSYYGPLRDMMKVLNPKDVGIVGLGAGIMLCIQAPERKFTVYEISPLVKEMAEKWFTFIKDCGEPEWRIGDGRLALNRDVNKQYDMLIIDAFSSDSVPTHLLTKEAISLYRSRIRPNGVIVFNISNRYYALRGPLFALSHNQGLKSLSLTDPYQEPRVGRMPSEWVVLLPSEADDSKLRELGWLPLQSSQSSAWSDDFANVLPSLKVLQNVK